MKVILAHSSCLRCPIPTAVDPEIAALKQYAPIAHNSSAHGVESGASAAGETRHHIVRG